MNRAFKKCLVAGASLLMLASAGAGINDVTVNARHVRAHRTYRRHNRRALRRYRHVRNVHRYDVYRLHHRRSLYSLEEQLGFIRADQANNFLKNDFYPELRKETKQDPEDYGHGAGTYFKNAPGDIDNGGSDSPDVSEAANGRYFSRTKFAKNYIKGLTNYLGYPYDNYNGSNANNGAEDCGAYDANYYASRLVTERYARQHHMSKRWLRSNLNNPIYGSNSNEAGTGMNNFMSGAQFTEWGNSNKDYRENLKIERRNDASHQYLTGLQYSHKIKSRYFSLRKPNYQELTYLKNCNYVRNTKIYSNTAIN